MRRIYQKALSGFLILFISLFMIACPPPGEEDPQVVADPVISPPTGTYEAPIAVTLSCATEGATIHITTDGTAPNAFSPECSTALSLTEATTLRAIAVKAGMNDSAVVTAVYAIADDNTVSDPVLSPQGGSYAPPVAVSISCETEDAVIHYTTDNTDPTAASEVYVSPLNLSSSTTVRAIAMKSGMDDSHIVAATYIAYDYLVSFDSQGATIDADPAELHVISPDTTSTALPANPAKTGYLFGGWWTGPDGNGTEFTASTGVTADITVYARWDSYSYTVTFDGQGATTAPDPATITVVSPDSATGPFPANPAKTGCLFGGWWTEPEGAGTQFMTDTTVSGDMTVYARWDFYSREWRDLAMSADATKIRAVANLDNIYGSGDSGMSWTVLAGVNYWHHIACSADGTILAAFTGSDQDGTRIWVSLDSGATWQGRADMRMWRGVDCSNDGSVMAAVCYGPNGSGIYVSADSGATWTQKLAVSGSWASVTVSGDGTKMAACLYQGGNIYSSADSGDSWQLLVNSPAQDWLDVTISDDGTRIAAVSTEAVYTSADSGATWTERISGGSCKSIDCSPDGTVLIAACDYVLVSDDAGVTWTERAWDMMWGWSGVAISDDGTKMAACACGGQVCTSDDGGVTWTQRF
ncbi:MAG: chitobiase/beta-hexosaminidase C-terminal domain-containing protein [Spirochaetales bacterium]|nr:chitobiase/beta-hexosaminidase C-terminal domain-containing protein [Spirochaetales bacterium]